VADFSYELRHDYCAGRLQPYRRAVSCGSWTTGSWRKKKARIALSSVKKRLRHRNIRKYYSLSRLSAVRNKELVKFIVQPSIILYLPLLYGGDSAVPVRKKDSNSYRIETM